MKFKLSEVKQIINEEIQRAEKIKELNEKKSVIENKLGTLLNEFTIVAPGDKTTFKHITTNGKSYLTSLAKLAKKYPESKFAKLIAKFATLQKEVEGALSDIAFKGEGKPESPEEGVAPGTPQAVVKPSASTKPAVPAAVAATVGSEEELAEGEGLSLTNQHGQNLKPNTPHKKVRSGLK